MKVFALALAVLISNMFCIPTVAKDKSRQLKQDKVSIAALKTDSHGTAIDGTSKAGAWDWTNWEEVVSDCKLYVFKTSMISKK